MCLVYNNIKGALLSRGLSRMQAIEHEVSVSPIEALLFVDFWSEKIWRPHGGCATATVEDLAKL